MSAFNIKSTVLTQRDATPKVLSEGTLARGTVRSGFGVQKVSSAGTDLNAAGTQIRLVTVPSHARIESLDYGGTSCVTSALDVAVWYPTYVPAQGANFLTSSNAWTLISSSKFLANITIPDTDQAFTTAFPAITAANLGAQEQPLWQYLGLATDPEMSLDIGFTVRTACSINGYVGLKARYTE